MPFEHNTPSPSGTSPTNPRSGRVAQEEATTEAARDTRTTGPTASTSEVPLEQGPKYLVTLKNGVREDIRVVLATWDTLTSLQDTRPQLFAAARAMADGKDETSAVRREMRRYCLTDQNGALLPQVRDVLLSGYQNTKEGPVLVNPIRFDSEADRTAFEACRQLAARNLSRFLAGESPRDDGQGPGSR